jgi:hypothetical protein
MPGAGPDSGIAPYAPKVSPSISGYSGFEMMKGKEIFATLTYLIKILTV